MMKSKKELFRNEWKYLISVGEKNFFVCVCHRFFIWILMQMKGIYDPKSLL
ncbi:MAG: hypothetical protein ACLTX6_03160 [Lachnospiraceae bacterium]